MDNSEEERKRRRREKRRRRRERKKRYERRINIALASQYFSRCESVVTALFSVPPERVPDLEARINRIIAEQKVGDTLEKRLADPNRCLAVFSKMNLIDLLNVGRLARGRVSSAGATRDAIVSEDLNALFLCGDVERASLDDLVDFCETYCEDAALVPDYPLLFLQYERRSLAADTIRADSRDTLFSPLASIACSSSTPPPSLN